MIKIRESRHSIFSLLSMRKKIHTIRKKDVHIYFEINQLLLMMTRISG